MSLIKKTTASIALVALTSGLFITNTSAHSDAEIKAANKLADAGIVVKHVNPADYQLDKEVLRQEIAAVARGIARVDKAETCQKIFMDVTATKPNTWACYTVEALADAKLIAKNKYFRPEANITKAEAIGMVVKAAYVDEYNYNPSLVANWKEQVVDFAVKKGIVSRFTNFDTAATRGFIFEAGAKALGDPTNVVCKILDNCDTTNSSTGNTETDEGNVVRDDGNLQVELSPLSPSNGSVPANADRAELLAFNVTAGKTDVTLKKATLKFTGLGDSGIVTKLAIYSDGVKLTKDDKSFNSKNEAYLSFDRDTVVKAGETKTLFVTATIDPSKANNTVFQNVYNQTIRVELTDLESSATVKGAELSGSTLVPTATANKGEATVSTTSANGRLYLGEEGILYNFSIKETSKKEDILVKSFTLSEGTGNTADLDNLSSLKVKANGKVVDAKITYQKSKVVITLDQSVKSGERVNFIVEGEATDDLNKELALELTDVYAVGINTGIAVEAKLGAPVVSSKTIEGTAVNFSFNKSGTNEVSKNTDNVQVGELVFVTTSNYTADLKVKVSGSGVVPAMYDNLSINDEELSKTSTNEFTLKDVYLNKGTTKLPLTLDVTDSATDGTKLKFTVEVTNLEEETLGEKVTNLNKVLNNTQLSKEVTVKDASFKLTAEKANITKVVPKGNQQVVLYKGRIDLTGGEDMTLDNLVFTKNGASAEFLDYISGATLNIGGKTFNGDVNTNTINFSSIYASIEKNSKSVSLLLTATLKDIELSNAVELEVIPTSVAVSADNAKDITTNLANTVSTKVNLVKKAELEAVDVNNELRDDVLAGSNNAEIGAFKLKDTNSDIYFNSFSIKAAVSKDTLASALSNIRLVDGSTVIANGGYVEKDGSDTYVRFDGFTLPQSGKDRTLKIVADISSVATGGGETASYLGKISFKQLKIDTSDSSFASDATTATISSEEVNIVPAIVTFAATEKFNTNGDNQAVIRVTVDTGNNELSTLVLKQLDFNKAITTASLKVNGDTVSPKASGDNLELNKDINGLTSFDISILLDGTTSGGAVILKKLELKATADSIDSDFESGNTDVSLGSYAQ